MKVKHQALLCRLWKQGRSASNREPSQRAIEAVVD